MATNFLEAYWIKKKMTSDLSDKKPINLFDFSNIKKPSELMAQKQTKPTQSGFSNVPKTNQIRYNDIDLENAQKLKDLWVPQDKIIELVNKKKQQREWVQEQPKDINDLWLMEESRQRWALAWQSIKGRIWEVTESWQRPTTWNAMQQAIQPLWTALKTAWSAIWAWFDIAGQWLAYITPDVVKDKLSDTWKAIWDKTPELVKQSAVTAIKEWWESYNQFKQANPFLADALEWSANIASLIPIWKWTQAWTKVLKQGWDKLVDTWKVVADKTSTLWKSIEGKWENFRNAISWLDEREVMALKNTTRDEWEWIINQAKQAKDNDYIQTPYNEWAKKANEAFKTLENNLDVNQTKRIETLQNAWIKSIDTTKVRQDIVADIEKTFNIKWATIKEWKVKYKTTPWRESLLDENPRNIEAIKLLENATQSRTPLQMMDNIKKMQNLIYDSNMLNKLGKDMENLITRSIWKLNKSFKEQVWWDYANILDDMAQDIKIKNELVRIFKASSWEEALNRWELAMKRLANGTTTSAEARQLALLVKEKTWIDLIKEARLRQLAMDLVDDKRWTTLFWAIEKWPKWIIGYWIEKARKLTPFDKEKTALARTLKPKKLNNANTTNTNNTAFNTTNKQANTKNNQNTIALTSKSNDKLLKASTTPKKIDRQEVKLLKPAKPTQIETKLKNLTTSNIDEISKSFTNDAQKLAKIKVVIREHLKNKTSKKDLIEKIENILKKSN